MKHTRTKPVVLAVLIIALGLIFGSCATTRSGGGKPAIVIAAFGSSYESGLSNLEDFDTAVRKAFPGTDVYWGFTANFIVNKLREEGKETVFARGVPVRTVAETYADLRQKGEKDVLVQCLFVMTGSEYREALNTPTKGLNVKYSHPLLYYPENIEKSTELLLSDAGGDGTSAVIFCAHGNEHHPEYNAELIQIDNYLRENYENAYLALMEGEPAFSPVQKSVNAGGAEHVTFVTYMLTYGDHMSNDVMGNEEDSWKEQLGLPAKVTGGMASMESIQSLYIEKMKTVLAQF